MNEPNLKPRPQVVPAFSLETSVDVIEHIGRLDRLRIVRARDELKNCDARLDDVEREAIALYKKRKALVEGIARLEAVVQS